MLQGVLPPLFPSSFSSVYLDRRMVGAVGFEPTTCCSQSSRATKLR